MHAHTHSHFTHKRTSTHMSSFDRHTHTYRFILITHTRKCIDIHSSYTPTHSHTQTRTHTHIQTHTHTHTRAYTLSHTYKHTDRQTMAYCTAPVSDAACPCQRESPQCVHGGATPESRHDIWRARRGRSQLPGRVSRGQRSGEQRRK